MLVLAELVVELARAALIACQARLDDMGLPAQRAPLVGRLLLGASARARCTVRSDCSCAYFTFLCEIVCQYVWASVWAVVLCARVVGPSGPKSLPVTIYMSCMMVWCVWNHSQRARKRGIVDEDQGNL